MSIATMMNTGLALIGWYTSCLKPVNGLSVSPLSNGYPERSRKKDRRPLTICMIAFSLSDMEPGGSVRLETKGDLTILMFRKEAVQ